MGRGKELVIKPKAVSASTSVVVKNFLDFGGALDSERDLPHELPSILIGILLTIVMSTIPYFTDTSILFYFLAVFAGILTWIVAQMVFLYREIKKTRYIITPNKVEIQNSFLNRNFTSTSIQDITDVSLEKSFIQKIFGTGTVKINTAGPEGLELRIEYIENADLVKQELYEMASQTSY